MSGGLTLMVVSAMSRHGGVVERGGGSLLLVEGRSTFESLKHPKIANPSRQGFLRDLRGAATARSIEFSLSPASSIYCLV